MLFNSLAFFVFAAAFFAIWPLVKHRRVPRLVAITVASLVFYGFWDPRYVLVLVATGLADFTFGRLMGGASAPRTRRLLLACSLTVNLGTLFAFKYSLFAAETVDGASAALGKPTHLAAAVPALLRVLPPGVSFYTFQSMSYTIDVYRRRLRPTSSPLQFLAFISMFPQLVAGPIVRARDLLPALGERPRDVPAEARASALALVVLGYFKKVVIADNLARAVEGVYGGAPGASSSFMYWLATAMFAVQIYCDFSGYSDIARGLARLMGYEFPKNFDHPYAARSLREFWQRWHITLSTWFRDYVYVPLGGGREHATRNLWITMLASGFWHGASFAFVAWGAWHALLLTVERWTRWPERAARSAVLRALARPLVFALVLVGWVFFRAGSLGKAFAILRVMLGSLPVVDTAELALARAWAPIGFLALGVAVDAIAWRFGERLRDARAQRALVPVGLALMIVGCIFFRGPGTAFIYFQF